MKKLTWRFAKYIAERTRLATERDEERCDATHIPCCLPRSRRWWRLRPGRRTRSDLCRECPARHRHLGGAALSNADQPDLSQPASHREGVDRRPRGASIYLAICRTDP